MMYRGVIIEESLANKDVLQDIKILSTKVEPVTDKHQTPWVKQWTLHTVEIPSEKASEVAEKISHSFDADHAHAWYADVKNETTHYIIFSRKVFVINRTSKDQYDAARHYGISLGIPDYQVDFKPVKHSVAIVIYSSDRQQILTVQRPVDDSLLPNGWGLPAAMVQANESPEAAVARAGREKLGVTVEIVRLLNEGEIDRATYRLAMKEYEVRITKGQPVAPQPVSGVTQYQRWEWAMPDKLLEAARGGSLCSRLFLERIGRKWK